MSPGETLAPTQMSWDTQIQEVARSLPSVLAGLRASYLELEERAARVERELQQANRERGELADRLHAADKLTALGAMAAGIAHEIRNPLNAVRGFAELLQRSEREDERAQRWAAHIVEGVREVDLIIDNLLSFGRPERLRLESVDGADLLAGAARLAQQGTELPHCVPATSVRGDVPAFLADRIKLRQAVRNLIENALEAQADSAAPRIEVTLAREDEQLVFSVADAGPGVPSELRTKILDPFFTTHADGTGLGLALVSVIARLHGGTVHCSPRPSALGGALFVLRIPFQPAGRPATTPQTQRNS